MLPVPRLVVFYNGTEEKANETALHLSDAFAPEHRHSADISVTVRMVNINKGYNQNLMDSCPPLSEYAWSVDSVRQYKKTDNLEAAIDRTLDSMPDSFLIKPFLEQHRAEVKNMLLTEYNEAETLEMIKRDYLAEGRAEGRAEGEEYERLSTIRKLMKSLKMTAQQAMAVLEIPSSEQGRYLDRL